MDFNAYILDWTMDDYPLLKRELADAGFAFKNEGEHIRLGIPYERLSAAAALFQKHLNAPYNYVDVQYPALGKTVIVFQQRVFTITNQQENETAKQWAIARGLPPQQADWQVSF